MPDDPGFAPVIIIGAGPAGLAVGACLKRAGVRSIVLEQAAEVGSSWRGHYDRLHLHTDRRNSALPFIPFPKGSPRYASRDAVVGYLEGYAARVRLDIRFGQQVVGARREAGTWRVTTEEGTFTSSYLVVAAGNARTPHLPSWPGMADFGGTLLHSSAYRNSHELAGDRALVVGFGNSGGEIAIDLSEGGFRTSISVRSPVNVIPREVLGLPILSIGIAQDRLPPSLADALNAPVLAAAVGDITSYGLRKLPYGPATQIRRRQCQPRVVEPELGRQEGRLPGEEEQLRRSDARAHRHRHHVAHPQRCDHGPAGNRVVHDGRCPLRRRHARSLRHRGARHRLPPPRA